MAARLETVDTSIHKSTDVCKVKIAAAKLIYRLPKSLQQSRQMRVDVTTRFRELAPARSVSTSNRCSAFSTEAMDLRSSLIELEKLLRRVKPQYLLPKCFIRSTGSLRMTEEEKDALDADLVELIKSCGSRIEALKVVAEAQPTVSSIEEYQREVVTYLLERLKSIANGAKQMQNKRYQQPFLLSSRLLPEEDRQELDALEAKIMRTRQHESALQHKNINSLEADEALKSPELVPATSEPTSPVASLVFPPKPEKLPVRQRIAITKQSQSSTKVLPGLAFAYQHEELEVTEEQKRRFQVENVQLHRHFQENLEDVKFVDFFLRLKMELKMTEISSLMGQFADKIMEQHSDIQLIHRHAQETKSNVTQSNRILEHAQSIGKGYGFIIFCFYVTFALILHVLHFFNS
ncbi:hypothetical protein CCR75_006775 [Bremia lactucae]|uniref:t-SNARE coiled-coil homology domain-containing protein n=1 Tax=Bremia lactucae TaxID=4779 RepID=A0A976IFI9_BRELC|nr:hypothetical protein CCR75_006775 [Bremia lactucae]